MGVLAWLLGAGAGLIALGLGFGLGNAEREKLRKRIAARGKAAHESETVVETKGTSSGR